MLDRLSANLADTALRLTYDDSILKPLIRALSEEARLAIEKVIEVQQGAFRAAREAHRAANAVYRSALTAELFNNQRLTDALAACRQTKD